MPALALVEARCFRAAAMTLLTALLFASDAGARGLGRDHAGPVEPRDADVRATGLVPMFPAGFQCVPIASPYGAATRHDGSARRDDRNAGLHGGMDLSLPSGTPLLAVARGEVIAKGQGGRLEGNYLWLRFAPEDTGLPYYLFAKYQHLSEVPAVNEGERVALGQVVAHSGNSGTAGGHYGAAGYPHLHLTVTAGPSAAYEKLGMFGSMVKAQDARMVDPLLLYVPGLDTAESVHALPESRKQVTVGIVDEAGSIFPANSKTAWPVRCTSLR